jgi:hypothetical protein
MPYFCNNDLNLLFIHIPKTGGTSIENYLSKKTGINLNNKSLYEFLNENEKKEKQIITSLQHITYKTILKHKKFFNINFNNLQIITIVRNPYERVVSDLFFYGSIKINTSKEEVYNILKNKLSNVNENNENNKNHYDNHTLPQYLFVTINDKLIDNLKILKTETLTQDMKNLGFQDFDLKLNSNSKKVNYYDYLNNDSIKLINDVYDLDFKFFNYVKK